jgi:hypothetical protein
MYFFYFEASRLFVHPLQLHLFNYFSVDKRIILKWIFRKWDVGAWTLLSWLRIGTGGELL